MSNLPRTKFRTALFWIFLFVIVAICLELLSFTGLYALGTWKGASYSPKLLTLSDRQRRITQLLIDDQHTIKQLSATVGWENKPDSQSTVFYKTINRSVKITCNSQGIRGHNEYGLKPEEGTIRIAAFGDSFTFGAEVDDEACWAEKLNGSSPDLEVLNFGIGGSSVDQGFLLYEKKGRTFEPHIVFIGFMTENINRHVNVYRAFYMPKGLPVAKPRFELSAGELRLLPNPMPSPDHYRSLLDDEETMLGRLGEHDFFYQQKYYKGKFDFLSTVRLWKIFSHMYKKKTADEIFIQGRYNIRSEAFQVTTRIFEKFYREVLSDGATPIILIFPHKNDITRYRDGVQKSYLPLLEWFDAHSMQYIDLMAAFEGDGKGNEIRDIYGAGHYSALGNKIIADYLLEHLQSKKLILSEMNQSGY